MLTFISCNRDACRYLRNSIKSQRALYLKSIDAAQMERLCNGIVRAEYLLSLVEKDHDQIKKLIDAQKSAP